MKTVLLTGATGHVGTALLPRLLAGGDTRVLALVRARDETHLAERRRVLAERAGVDEGLELVAGDVSAPGLGLSTRDRGRVLAEVDAVMHSAASVRFDMTQDEAAASNLAATQQVLALCRDLADAGRLDRYDHVSTCYIAGDRRGTVYEHEIDVGQGFRNKYEWSKCQAELAVRDATQAGLPVCVHRPSIVVGDSRTGATRSFNVLYWPLKLYARGLWRTFPGRVDTPVDLVPVDWLADAMVALHRDDASIGATVHLAQGPAAPTVQVLMDAVQAQIDGPPLRVVDQGRYRRFVRPLLWPFFQTKRGAAVKRGGDAYLPYFTGNPVFDATTRDELLPQLPPPDPLEVLRVIVDFAMRRDFGGR
ncbi:MAG: SDR family oxidoreductase [Alphaproteobacteria bacterium]|nr:SDR family oxidoreductase [Alphaproteobacteria bacterium]